MAESAQSKMETTHAPANESVPAQLAELIVRKCSADDATRRGLCLLNAGRFDEATAAFGQARRDGANDARLGTLLGAASLGHGDPGAAATYFGAAGEGAAGVSVHAIRVAHALRAGDRVEDAVTVLRRAIRKDPDNAELHFQLGTVLASGNQNEEAELRLTQALCIDRTHVDARVSLALLCGVRHDLRQAVHLLRHAQSLRPDDARIAELLTRAVRAATQQGHAVAVRASVPENSRVLPDRWIERLAAMVESDPDFVDALLSLPPGCGDERIFESLLRTLKRVLERVPEHAELHYHCGRVLDRLGRPQEAVEHVQRAIDLDPTSTRALIELSRLYQRADRKADATVHLERAVRAGADYADVHFLLGNLYRDRGMVVKAKCAYRSAIALNEKYGAAREALAELLT